MSGDRRAALLGGAGGLLVHLWLLTAGSWDVFARRAGADFFDAQAAAWLDGHWWVPRSVVGIEGIVVDGHTQIYFGPLPALLRLPVALVGGAAGRLGVVSMLATAAVASWAAVRLLHQIHGPATPVTPALVGLVAFVTPAGTTLAFLASRPLVYHEAAAWGTATALVAFSFLLDALERPSPRTTALAVAATTACAMARVSVALGPVVGLALLAMARAWRARRPTVHTALALVPVGALAAVNLVRFGTLFSVPFQQQVQSFVDPQRPAFFAANGGFFHLRFLPTTLWHYLQPVGLRPAGWFPFVEFPPPGRVFGGARFDLVDRTASVPATMPALALLALVGLAVVARRGPASHRVLAVASMAAVAPALLFGYVAHRYLADFVPGLVVLALLGLAALPARRVVFAGLAVLLGCGVWFNVGLGLVHQRVWGPRVDEPTVRSFTATRLAIDRRLGLARPVVHRSTTLPDGVGAGEWVVLGDCDALYLETGIAVGFLPLGHWRPVERPALTTVVRVTPGTVGELARFDERSSPSRLRLVAAGRQRARLVWDDPRGPAAGPAFDLEEPVDLSIVVDPNVDELAVRDGHRLLLGVLYLGDGFFTLRAGTRRPPPRPTVCRDLLESADEARRAR
jgi:hypothetical protein